MEISASTVNVLKNFAAINSNIVIKPGNQIMTISEAKNLLAMATVPENFETVVGIYDLQEFLNVLGLVDNPTVRFAEDYMNIGGRGGRELVKYYYADPDMLTTHSKPIEMPATDVSFTLDQTTLTGLKRAASVFGHGQLLIAPAGAGAIKLSVVDPENSTANTYSIEVMGEYEDQPFTFVLNISNLKMVQDDYEVKIASKQFTAQFTNSNGNLVYWVAMEKSSKYGE